MTTKTKQNEINNYKNCRLPDAAVPGYAYGQFDAACTGY